ncbi:MAG: hypothetical protein DHS20C16_14600 [Phycisphaerae bacterium]|nr:MAG: hypothetical protein DHS20C16_14600 [Phycisphaerae bacterium]
MDMIQEAKVAVAAAEASLKSIIERGVREHRYAEVAELARIADRLAQLLHVDATTTSLGGESPTRASGSARRATKKRKAKGRTASKPYPRFERDQDKLVKIGWSKKAREEYEHRAPRLAALAFAQHLDRSVSRGKMFAIDDLLPIHDSVGEEIPSYQVYLTLAWLRNSGAVQKEGRNGYVISCDKLDGSMFDLMWDRLPKKQ